MADTELFVGAASSHQAEGVADGEAPPIQGVASGNADPAEPRGNSLASGSNKADQAWLTASVPVAIDVGWTMAVLYGRIESPETARMQLPSEHELKETQRARVELVRLSSLLAKLGSLAPKNGSSIPTGPEHPEVWPDSTNVDVAPDSKAKQRAELLALNLKILTALAGVSRETELAYQLGRALRDTANPPDLNATNPDVSDATAKVLDLLDRGRISRLQEWLKNLAPYVPGDTAAVVSSSLGKWSDFAATTLEKGAPGGLYIRTGGKLKKLATEMLDFLVPQGDSWLNLLTGTPSTTGLLTPEGYVAAAEAALSRAARMAVGVLRHYWRSLVILLGVAAVVLYFASTLPGGAGKIWTQIGTVAGSLGITAKGIGSTLSKLAQEGARPVYALEEVEAKAWAITTMPRAILTPRGIYTLRRSGIRRSNPLGRA